MSLRIGSAVEAPVDRRMLATWLSHDDLERLVIASLTAQEVGHTVIYGMSDNRLAWWDNSAAQHIGFHAQDSADRFRAVLEARRPQTDPDDPVAQFQGGSFVTRGPF